MEFPPVNCGPYKSVCIWMLLGHAALGVISGEALAQPPIVNEWCPVMTEEKAEPEFTLIHDGKEVRFCCDRCMAKFQANPDKYIGRLPQLAAADAVPTSPSSHAAEPAAVNHGHDGEDHGTAAEREPLLGRVHPAIVHFPLAGIPLALMGFVAWVVTGREAFAKADVLPLFAATLAAVAAVITGNVAHDAMRFSESMHVIVERHQFISTTVMILAICLSLLRVWRWNRITGVWRLVYGGGLCIAAGLLAFTGFLGGSLVFGPDHLKW